MGSLWTNKHKILRKTISLICLFVFVSNFVFHDALAVIVEPKDMPFAPSEEKISQLDVDTFVLPPDLGIVRYSWKAPVGPSTIIHIQDAHCNYAAQKKIAEILKYLNKEYGIISVNLEGGRGDYDLSDFTDIYDRDMRNDIADYFVRWGRVNGAELFALNNPDKVDLWGVEDTGLYIKNLDVYRDSLNYKEEVNKYLGQLDYIIGNLKRHIFSPELLELDKRFAEYKEEKIEFKDYLLYLIEKAKQKGINIREFPNMYLLNQSFEEENKINFKKANDERDILIDEMERILSKNELTELVSRTVQFKNKAISQNDFYEYLIKKAKGIGKSLQSFPELQKYIIYISLYNAVDKTAVMDEMEKLEAAIKETLFQNEKQRELDLLSKNLILTKNIFEISFTKQDYMYYKKNESAFDVSNYIAFINREAPLYKISPSLDKNIGRLDEYRARIFKFFEYSFQRDDVFLKNLKFSPPSLRGPEARSNLKTLSTNDQRRAAILITGGFHTENLCDLFQKNNISYISIMPTFKNEQGQENPYFNILSGGMSPLEKEIDSAMSAMQVYDFLSKLGVEVEGSKARDIFRMALEAMKVMRYAAKTGSRTPRAFRVGADKYIVLAIDNNNAVKIEVVQARARLPQGTEVVKNAQGEEEIFSPRNIPALIDGFHQIVDERLKDAKRDYLNEENSEMIRNLLADPNLPEDLKEDLRRLVEREKSGIQLVDGLFTGHTGQAIYLPGGEGLTLEERKGLSNVLIYELVIARYKGKKIPGKGELLSRALATAVVAAFRNEEYDVMRSLLDGAEQYEKPLWEMSPEERRAQRATREFMRVAVGPTLEDVLSPTSETRGGWGGWVDNIRITVVAQRFNEFMDKEKRDLAPLTRLGFSKMQVKSLAEVAESPGLEPVTMVSQIEEIMAYLKKAGFSFSEERQKIIAQSIYMVLHRPDAYKRYASTSRDTRKVEIAALEDFGLSESGAKEYLDILNISADELARRILETFIMETAKRNITVPGQGKEAAIKICKALVVEKTRGRAQFLRALATWQMDPIWDQSLGRVVQVRGYEEGATTVEWLSSFIAQLDQLPPLMQFVAVNYVLNIALNMANRILEQDPLFFTRLSDNTLRLIFAQAKSPIELSRLFTNLDTKAIIDMVGRLKDPEVKMLFLQILSPRQRKALRDYREDPKNLTNKTAADNALLEGMLDEQGRVKDAVMDILQEWPGIVGGLIKEDRPLLEKNPKLLLADTLNITILLGEGGKFLYGYLAKKIKQDVLGNLGKRYDQASSYDVFFNEINSSELMTRSLHDPETGDLTRLLRRLYITEIARRIGVSVDGAMIEKISKALDDNKKEIDNLALFLVVDRPSARDIYIEAILKAKDVDIVNTLANELKASISGLMWRQITSEKFILLAQAMDSSLATEKLDAEGKRIKGTRAIDIFSSSHDRKGQIAFLVPMLIAIPEGEVITELDEVEINLNMDAIRATMMELAKDEVTSKKVRWWGRVSQKGRPEDRETHLAVFYGLFEENKERLRDERVRLAKEKELRDRERLYAGRKEKEYTIPEVIAIRRGSVEERGKKRAGGEEGGAGVPSITGGPLAPGGIHTGGIIQGLKKRVLSFLKRKNFKVTEGTYNRIIGPFIEEVIFTGIPILGFFGLVLTGFSGIPLLGFLIPPTALFYATLILSRAAFVWFHYREGTPILAPMIISGSMLIAPLVFYSLQGVALSGAGIFGVAWLIHSLANIIIDYFTRRNVRKEIARTNKSRKEILSSEMTKLEEIGDRLKKVKRSFEREGISQIKSRLSTINNYLFDEIQKLKRLGGYMQDLEALKIEASEDKAAVLASIDRVLELIANIRDEKIITRMGELFALEDSTEKSDMQDMVRECAEYINDSHNVLVEMGITSENARDYIRGVLAKKARVNPRLNARGEKTLEDVRASLNDFYDLVLSVKRLYDQGVKGREDMWETIYGKGAVQVHIEGIINGILTSSREWSSLGVFAILINQLIEKEVAGKEIADFLYDFLLIGQKYQDLPLPPSEISEPEGLNFPNHVSVADYFSKLYSGILGRNDGIEELINRIRNGNNDALLKLRNMINTRNMSTRRFLEQNEEFISAFNLTSGAIETLRKSQDPIGLLEALKREYDQNRIALNKRVQPPESYGGEEGWYSDYQKEVQRFINGYLAQASRPEGIVNASSLKVFKNGQEIRLMGILIPDTNPEHFTPAVTMLDGRVRIVLASKLFNIMGETFTAQGVFAEDRIRGEEVYGGRDESRAVRSREVSPQQERARQPDSFSYTYTNEVGQTVEVIIINSMLNSEERKLEIVRHRQRIGVQEELATTEPRKAYPIPPSIDIRAAAARPTGGEEVEEAATIVPVEEVQPYSGMEEILGALPADIRQELRRNLNETQEKAAGKLMGAVADIYGKMGLTAKNYHNHAHNLGVTFAMLRLSRGDKPEDIIIAFLAALLHDFHIRVAEKTDNEGRILGTPAFVQETIAQIEWLFGNEKAYKYPYQKDYPEDAKMPKELTALRGAIKDFLSKTKIDINVVLPAVKAMIRRTDFASDVAPAELMYKYMANAARRTVIDDRFRQMEEITDRVIRKAKRDLTLKYEDIRRKIYADSWKQPKDKRKVWHRQQIAWLARQQQIEMNYLDALKGIGDPLERRKIHSLAFRLEKGADQAGFYWLIQYDRLPIEVVEGEPPDNTRGLKAENPNVGTPGTSHFFFSPEVTHKLDENGQIVMNREILELLKNRDLPLNFRKNLYQGMKFFAERSRIPASQDIPTSQDLWQGHSLEIADALGLEITDTGDIIEKQEALAELVLEIPAEERPGAMGTGILVNGVAPPARELVTIEEAGFLIVRHEPSGQEVKVKLSGKSSGVNKAQLIKSLEGLLYEIDKSGNKIGRKNTLTDGEYAAIEGLRDRLSAAKFDEVVLIEHDDRLLGHFGSNGKLYIGEQLLNSQALLHEMIHGYLSVPRGTEGIDKHTVARGVGQDVRIAFQLLYGEFPAIRDNVGDFVGKEGGIDKFIDKLAEQVKVVRGREMTEHERNWIRYKYNSLSQRNDINNIGMRILFSGIQEDFDPAGYAALSQDLVRIKDDMSRYCDNLIFDENYDVVKKNALEQWGRKAGRKLTKDWGVKNSYSTFGISDEFSVQNLFDRIKEEISRSTEEGRRPMAIIKCVDKNTLNELKRLLSLPKYKHLHLEEIVRIIDKTETDLGREYTDDVLRLIIYANQTLNDERMGVYFNVPPDAETRVDYRNKMTARLVRARYFTEDQIRDAVGREDIRPGSMNAEDLETFLNKVYNGQIPINITPVNWQEVQDYNDAMEAVYKSL